MGLESKAGPGTVRKETPPPPLYQGFCLAQLTSPALRQPWNFKGSLAANQLPKETPSSGAPLDFSLAVIPPGSMLTAGATGDGGLSSWALEQPWFSAQRVQLPECS